MALATVPQRVLLSPVEPATSIFSGSPTDWRLRRRTGWSCALARTRKSFAAAILRSDKPSHLPSRISASCRKKARPCLTRPSRAPP